MLFPLVIELRPRNAPSRAELCEEIVNLKLEVRLLHDALVQAEILNANQRDVITHLEAVRELARQQSALIDEQEQGLRSMIAAMDAELIVRDRETGRVMIQQSFTDQ